jgi:hypothetical protein
MGQKRPSLRLPTEVVDRAKEMRRAGATMREIAQAVGASRAALGEHFKADPDLAGPVGALQAENAALTLRLDALVEDASSVCHGILAELGKRMKGSAPAKGIGARELREVRATIVEIRKLAELMRGRPTTRTENVQSGTLVVEHTEAEAAVLAALREREAFH